MFIPKDEENPDVTEAPSPGPSVTGCRVADFWHELTQVAERDAEVAMFLRMFGPWAGGVVSMETLN